MAEKRCFSMSIVDSDAFMEMPLSTQCFYFHLGMRADDYGFVNNPRRIAKLVGASDDDFKLLVSKRFLLLFDNGVVVIKHWRMNNNLRDDRLKAPQYPDVAAKVFIKDNGSYTEIPHDGLISLMDLFTHKQMTGKCLADDRQMTGKCPPKRREDKIREDKIREDKIREGKVRIEEENKEEGFSPETVEKLKTALSYQLSFLEISDFQLSILEQQIPFERMERYMTKLSQWKQAHPSVQSQDYKIIAHWAEEDGYEFDDGTA